MALLQLFYAKKYNEVVVHNQNCLEIDFEFSDTKTQVDFIGLFLFSLSFIDSVEF